MQWRTSFRASRLLGCAGITGSILASCAAVPTAKQSALREIDGATDPAQLSATVNALVGFGTRHTLSDTTSDSRGIGAARRWTQARFQKISADCGGCLSILTPSQTMTGSRLSHPTDIVDVVAIQKGISDPGRVIIITAHIDSRVTDVMNADGEAPGADDDASGVAAVIEAARVLSRHQFAATIVYGVLSGEEQGLYGGKVLADYAKAQGWKVEADLNNDIVGSSLSQTGVRDDTRLRVFSEGTRDVETTEEARQRRFQGGENDSASRNVARYAKTLAERYIPDWHVALIYRLDRFGRGGDHSAFNADGMPAVRFTEGAEDYRHQHQDLRTESGVDYGDTIQHLDFAYLARVCATNAITAASMASAPAPPNGVKVAGAVTPDTGLSWSPGPDGMPTSYKIYWRDTSEPQWTYSKDVGHTDKATLSGIAVDDFAFGVSSVSADGYESPVVAPGAAGAF